MTSPPQVELPTAVDKARDDALAFRPFPVDVLPEPIRTFVERGAKAIGCDASYIVLPLLSALAAAIGNTHQIELKSGWTEPAILWTAIVGESGTMKTPASRLALKAIRLAQQEAFDEYKTACAAFHKEMLVYEPKLAEWKKLVHGGGEAGPPPEKPRMPIPRRHVVSDATVEAMGPILRDNPRGALLAIDELAGWLAAFDLHSGKGRVSADSPRWLSMHSGEAVTIDRKTAIPPTIHIPSASLSIAGGIQPGILAKALGEEHHENGLLARLLFAMPPRMPRTWSEAEVDQETEDAVQAVFDRLLDLTPEPGLPGEYEPRTVVLSPSGKKVWIQFFNEHGRELAELSGDEAAAWSKLEGCAARLALVVHLVRFAAGDPDVPTPETSVDQKSMAAGVALVRWFGREARRVYSVLSETKEQRNLRELEEWIGRRGGTCTVRDLTHSNRKYRNQSAVATTDLCKLAAAGRGTLEWPSPGPSGGAPSPQFRLGPPVTVTKTPADDPAKAGSGDGDRTEGDTALPKKGEA